MSINCTLKTKVNPTNVSYEWFSCNSANCDEESLKLKERSSSLLLHNQIYTQRWYQCRAKNDAGSSNVSIEVVNIQAFKSKLPFFIILGYVRGKETMLTA